MSKKLFLRIVAALITAPVWIPIALVFGIGAIVYWSVKVLAESIIFALTGEWRLTR